jgi:serine/threonine-protein kinase
MDRQRPVVGEIAPGHVLGRYELLLPIAAGGMAMVWAARLKGTRGFQKIVAVKTMLPKLSDDAQFEQMFLDEASLASQIRHPHVVEISDLGEQDGVLFLVMEWIDGIPLNQLMKAAKPHGGIPLPIGVRLVMQACAGLHAAHELQNAKGQPVGLVHRDISPQNILVTYDGVTKVVDFGVAKATALGNSATAAGQLKGKVSYMAPEQVRGETIDRRVDIFALGIVLYALTTGKHPFRRESEAATMYTIASNDPVVAPRKFLPDYPAGLEAVLLKALAKDASDRYATASEFLRALDQALPVAERANTEEDVSTFLTKLLGAKREEGRIALNEALQRADQLGPSRAAASSLVSPTAQSSVSSVSTVGVAANLGPENTFTSVGAPDYISRRRRRTFAIVALLLVCGAAGAAAFALGRETSPASQPAAAATVSPSPLASQASVKPEPSVAATGIDPAALPIETAAPESTGTAAALPHHPVGAVNLPAAPVVGAAPVKTPNKAPSAAPPSKQWRHDPGF